MKTKQSVHYLLSGALALGLFSTPHSVAADSNYTALLVVAHGARDAGWNQRVVKAVDQLQWDGPKGVAFLSGQPPEHALPHVAAQLDQPGVQRIVIVPLLISSFSGHYEEIRYYAGQRKDMPDDDHAPEVISHPGEPHGHGNSASLKTKAPLSLTTAMDGHLLLSRILADQIKPLVKVASNETLVLVAHGPNEDAENERWLGHLRTHAGRLQEQYGFRRVAALTLRDDAPTGIRDAATEKLRSTVKTAAADSRVLVLPVLISVGHLQSEIRERLKGTEYTMAEGGVANHPLAIEWLRQQAYQNCNVTSSAVANANRGNHD